MNTYEYAVLLSCATSDDINRLEPLPTMLVAMAPATRQTQGNGLDHAILRRRNGGMWLTLAGRTPVEEIRRRWQP